MHDKDILNKTVEYLIKQERSTTSTHTAGEIAKDDSEIKGSEDMINSFFDFLSRKYILQKDLGQPLDSFYKIADRNKARLEDKRNKIIAEFLAQYYGISD